jgi:hydrogenase/urease accessory protein HupE
VIRTLAAALVLSVFAGEAAAHELRPASLQLEQTGAETWDVRWKVPARGGEQRLALDLAFPATCARVAPARAVMVDEAYSELSSIVCAGGLAGGVVRVDGLASTQTDVLVRLERLDDSTQVARLTPSSTSFVVQAEERTLDVARTYAVLGVEHILMGPDHLLFVLVLLLLTGGAARTIRAVTAFTLAHSLTLAAAVLGVVHVPQAPVEATIALSIAFVAAEVVQRGRGRDSVSVRAPWIVAFAFGLLHGLGFAGALSEIGLPEQHIPAALLFFNLGVELGQVLFIGAMLSLMAMVRRTRWPLPDWASLVPAYAIGGLAMFWVFERIAAY